MVNKNFPISMIDDEPQTHVWFERKGWEVIVAPECVYFESRKSKHLLSLK